MDRKLQCFVVSPIGAPNSDIREHADAVLNYIIRPALVQIATEGGAQIEAIRSDEIGVPGRIEDQMIGAILSHDLCIVILTGSNANVFYELAIAQAAGRPVVLMCLAGETLPFDVKDYRTISYDLKPQSVMEGKWVPIVARHVRAVLDKDYKPPSILSGYAQNENGTKSYLLNAQSKEFGDAPKFNETVRHATKHCSLMGIALSSWGFRESIEVLNDLGNRRVNTRFLTMSPDNPALEYLVNESLVHESITGVRDKVARMAEFFGDMSLKYPSFESRLIQRGLPHNQIIVTDQTALVLQYMFSRGTAESPLLQFPANTELHDAFADEFEDLWALNDPNA